MDKPFTAYVGNEPYVFVCHAHADEGVVYPEIGWLHEQGINLWYDEGISAGKIWREEIGDAIKGASGVLYYISASSLASDHCDREINFALDQHKNVLPVYLEDVSLTTDLEVGLSRVQALHRYQDANYQRRLLNALGQLAEALSTPPGIVRHPTERHDRTAQRKEVGVYAAIATFSIAILVFITFVVLEKKEPERGEAGPSVLDSIDSEVQRPSLSELVARATPEMLPVPGGTFQMGCVSGIECQEDEQPLHPVNIEPFLLSRYEVTFTQWDACVEASGCSHRPNDSGWGRDDRPVININWHDAQEYLRWLNRESGLNFRLPTEAEWEYAARSGTATVYPWGNDIGHRNANCDGCGSPWDNDRTAPVGSFQANGFGLHDMHGNVYEWTQDAWHTDYVGAPGDGSAWEADGDALFRVSRGGCWLFVPWGVRSAYRINNSATFRANLQGFRIALSGVRLTYRATRGRTR